jgi:hypothetical protein
LLLRKGGLQSAQRRACRYQRGADRAGDGARHQTSRQEYEFDIIIYATGFDAITGAFDRIVSEASMTGA